VTVLELAQILADLPNEMPVLVHLGWDLGITETDVDEDGLVLFADDTEVAAVNRHWYDAQVRLIDGSKEPT
jgi:hypothetical protein